MKSSNKIKLFIWKKKLMQNFIIWQKWYPGNDLLHLSWLTSTRNTKSIISYFIVKEQRKSSYCHLIRHIWIIRIWCFMHKHNNKKFLSFPSSVCVTDVYLGINGNKSKGSIQRSCRNFKTIYKCILISLYLDKLRLY